MNKLSVNRIEINTEPASFQRSLIKVVFNAKEIIENVCVCVCVCVCKQADGSG
jgi:hypothetical protein